MDSVSYVRKIKYGKISQVYPFERASRHLIGKKLLLCEEVGSEQEIYTRSIV